MKRLSILLLCSICSCILFAQDDTTMQEVSVTALRRLKDTGIQQTTLDTTVLHQSIAASMSDILTQHSSLFIKSYGRATESTAEFRGTSASHTQVLWNGMKINSPMLGTVDFSMIPAYFIDKAQLLHGASSLALTGGGLGGAIDLTTQPPFSPGWNLQYIQGVGSFHTFDQFLRATYSNGRWSSSTRVAYSTSKNNFPYTNYDKKLDERDAVGNIIQSYHPTEYNRSGYFDDVHALQELYYTDDHGNRLSAQVWYTYSLRGLPFLSVDYRDDADFRNEQRQNSLRSVLGWERTFDRWSLNIKGGYVYQNVAYDYMTTHTTFSSDITHSQSFSHQGFLQADADYMPHRNWLLTAHVGTRYNHVRSQDKSPFHIGDNYNKGRLETEASLSVKYRPIDRLSLSALLREEVYRSDFVSPIPAFFGEYALFQAQKNRADRISGSLIAKASIARNYRYPTMDDLYFKPGGNPDLRPECGFTYDGGFEGTLYVPFGKGGKKQGLSIEGNLSAFDSYISDWILWTPNAKGYWHPSNLKKVHNYGVELSLKASLDMPHDWHATLGGNYAYTPSLNQSEELAEDDASFGKQLVYVPLHSANLSAHLSWRTWSLTYQWNFYSERYTTTSNEVNYITGRLKPYFMNNITLEKQFHWRYLHASLKGTVNNLFDREYVTVLSRPMAGRNFEIFIELRPQWKTRKVR